MTNDSDESLVERSARGDARAFAELIRRHEQPLATLIRYRIDNRDDAEDVLQETLVDAWTGMPVLRDPGGVRWWLLQVSRNRCRDYYRSKYRRESPTESVELETQANRLVPGLARHAALREDVLGALRAVPGSERAAAELFYLQGFTISEIAERHQCAEGTIKRRLFSARERLREALGVTPRRSTDMSASKQKSKGQPFPDTRPEIVVMPLDIEPFEIDCLELKWWSIVPVIGNRASMADYHPPGWTATLVRDMAGVRKALVHEIEGVEVEMRTWERATGWRDSSHSFFGRIRDDAVQWLGGVYKGEETQVRTFLDEGFVWAFPDTYRRLNDDGLFELLPGGSLRTTRERSECKWSGAGCFTVGIGDREFRCLRLVGLEGRIEDPKTAATEIFVSDAGRTVLIRQYCQPEVAASLGLVLDPNLQITIDSVAFVHWCDTVTGVGAGLD